MNLTPSQVADPIYMQRLEQALSVQPLVDEIQTLYFKKFSLHEDPDKTESSSSDSDSDVEYISRVRKQWKQLYQPSDRQSDKEQLFNFSHLGPDREWLRTVLLSDTSDSDSESSDSYSINYMLQQHVREKRIRRQYLSDPNKANRFMYYGAGLLSTKDLYKERERQRKSHEKEKKKEDAAGKVKRETGTSSKKHRKSNKIKVEGDPNDDDSHTPSPSKKALTKKEAKDLKKSLLAQSPGALTARRKKLWTLMSKKEISKVQRNKANLHKEILSNCKKLAQSCMKFHRQKAMQSQKNMKETVWRAKRLTREMQAFWKKSDRYERETKRRMEKEAEEQRKLDVELIEAKRQQRKLNFLITQTELYAHFMSKKLGQASAEDQLRILSQLDEEKIPRLEAIDDYNSDTQKALLMNSVRHAVEVEEQRSQQFGAATLSAPIPIEVDRPQPTIFRGNLKHYQLKGMNWLASLYDEGINGILADEMGLGKTVQSIAFLCHIAETYDVWGPFLIISPASTLHNWQQEMLRFVPDFKVVPYWGSPQERKILRQFWDQKNLHTKEASFHVVITSYQLVVSDFKYFNRIKWQYMILDEAQAIKSSSSMRWKLLLTFSCRNRLLLSGTPIQNSMAELWALLHFIMPTMFDSHDEFNEWFSKDIESHAENKTSIDERHLSRLHMILKPFMLRRIKKDVENELSDKIEIMVYCPLTSRQKLLYSALKKKIRIEDLIHSSYQQVSSNIASNLMNLVMQFRKVCNHPELFERRDAKAPLVMHIDDYVIPKLVYDEAVIKTSIPSRRHILYNLCSIWHPQVSHENVFHNQDMLKFFSFIRLLGLSSGELYKFCTEGLLYRLIYTAELLSSLPLHRLQQVWSCKSSFFSSPTRSQLDMFQLSSTHEDLCIFTHSDHMLHSMPETTEHRLHRARMSEMESLPEFPHIERKPVILPLEPTYLPSCFYQITHKLATTARQLYASSRACAWHNIEHAHCNSRAGHDTVWYGSPALASAYANKNSSFANVSVGGLLAAAPKRGWSNINIPDKLTLVYDAGKLSVLDDMLRRLKVSGHRVLIYSQMTKMIDLLVEFMGYRKYRYMRLDGSSKISERRDMVADFQSRVDIFVFLLSTRAGGLGINLTAADTVIFYDSDWNPTVDQQAMDRAHRLGQTKQVTVYRLICKDTIEERILQRAREKSEIQRMVISGGNFKPDTLKAKEVVSLLLDDEELEQKYQQKQLEKRQAEEQRQEGHKEKDRERKRKFGGQVKENTKKIKEEDVSFDSSLGSPSHVETMEEVDVMTTDNEVLSSFESPVLSGVKLKKKPGKRGRPVQRRSVPGRDGASALDADGRARRNSSKRGRGRPRIKNVGPAHQGYRMTAGPSVNLNLTVEEEVDYEISVDQ